MEALKDILVVEDEPVVLDSVRRSLRPEHLTVDLAGDAAAASDLLRQGEYKVALCDVILPGSSGFEVLEEIRLKLPPTPVIMITGYATREHVVESFRCGAFDFLPKPFDVDELLAVVTRALRFHARASGNDGDARAADRRCLGRHAWALVDGDGSATLGAAETFRGTVGDVEAVRLPTSEHTEQGEVCVWIRGRDRLLHRVWAPLSGRVIAVNHDLESAPQLVDRDPFGRGWLVRIVPDSADEELLNLTRRQPVRR